jgi:tight adherence protein C
VVRVTSTLAWGLLCGVGLGLGIWSLASLLPALGRHRFAERVAPYLVDVSEEARVVMSRRRPAPTSPLDAVAGPVIVLLRTAVSRLFGGNDALALRLRRAASPLTIEEFRLRQVAWGLGGLVAGCALVVMAVSARPVPPAVVIATPILVAAAAFTGRDRLLTRAVARRAARMADEFPTVLELLTLSLSAGEGMSDALRRVARTGTGALAGELGRTVAETGMGVPLATALRGSAQVICLPQFTRCVDAVVVALERGSPIAEVLRAQASDAREVGKRTLLEKAGSKEIGMLVPLVFLILPVTVLFAMFPGVMVLRSGF